MLPEPLRTSGREVATAEDLAILILVLEACTRRMNADGSMPTARIRRNWDALCELGEVDRPFNPKRHACLRDFLSREGLLDWEDESYLPSPMSVTGEGKAARWRAGDRLLAMIEEARGGLGHAEGRREERDGNMGDEDKRDEDHLYGDNPLLDDPDPMTVGPNEGNVPRWLAELTLSGYRRPVLGVPSGMRRAA
jgi:hypothetical protein